MADLRADLAALRAARAKVDLDRRKRARLWALLQTTRAGCPVGPPPIETAYYDIIASVDAFVPDERDPTDAYLAALARIAEIVDRTDPADGTDDYRALDEIRAALAGLEKP